jgi:VWFA-related protein
MKFRKVLIPALFAGVLCAPISISAQAAAGQSAPGPDKAGAVTLNVVVTDKSGAPVADLQPGDFKLLLDKKHPQEITSVQAFSGLGDAATSPDELILVFDDVNPDIMTITQEKKSLGAYLLENGGQLPLPTTLVILLEKAAHEGRIDQGGAVVSPKTRDGKVLLDFLNTSITGLNINAFEDGWFGTVHRQTPSLALLDKLTGWAANQPGKKLMMWMSPSWRMQAGGNMTNASQKDLEQIFNHVVGLLTLLRAGNTTLYMIDPDTAGSDLTFQTTCQDDYMKGADQFRHVDYGHLLLPVLAYQSGGQLVWGTNTEVGPSINKFIQDAKAYYVVTFNPPPASHPNEFHSIDMQVNKSGLKARTNTIFYAQPPVVVQPGPAAK